MRVLVTAGTGFVGSHTVAALVEASHQVHLLVRARQQVAPADSVRWLLEQGHISRRQAGQLARR